MNLLAFETATEGCSVAVSVDGRIAERFEIAPRRHAELALPWAEALLAEAGIGRRQLDAIAVSRGPGAFTGVRLGIGIAQGIALGLDLPLVAISTLAVLAAGAAPGRVLAAIDARMGEVYLGTFVNGIDGCEAQQDELLARPDEVALPPGSGWQGVGTGFAAGNDCLQARLGPALVRCSPDALPRARDLARLAAGALARGEGMAPERIEPAYLRNQVALTLVEQRRTRA